jgi:hypothetical protein
MKKIIAPIVLTIALIAIVGCFKEPVPATESKPLAKESNYELISAGNGAAYRMDKSSGDVVCIVGNQYKRLDEWGDASTNSIRIWPTKVFPALGNARIDMRTRLEPDAKDRMQYLIRISPVSESVRTNCMVVLGAEKQPKLWIFFKDAAGLKTHQFSLHMADFFLGGSKMSPAI